MPQYKKVFDIGTYTGNGGQYRVGIPTLRPVGPTGTQVASSLRFRAAPYLTRTFGTPTSQNTWTLSWWMKIGAAKTRMQPFEAGSSNRMEFELSATTGRFNVGDATTSFATTTQNLIDSSKWYHMLVVANGTSSAMKIYVDGILQPLATTNNLTTSYWNASGTTHTIGCYNGTGGPVYYYDGYLSEVTFVDGQALTPSSFAEFNPDGIWVPKAYSGTYGNNGFNLKFASGAVGTDSSGNGNTWTLNNGFNVTTANTTYDILTDSPTDYLSGTNNIGNYATLDQLNKGNSLTINNGNMNVDYNGASTDAITFSTILFNAATSNYYAEFTLTAISIATSGVSAVGITIGTTIGTNDITSTGTAVLYLDDGTKVVNGSSTSYGATWTTNDVISVQINNGTVTFYKNGVSQGNATTGVTGTYKFVVRFRSGTTRTATIVSNFGQRAFAYSLPSGAAALNTYNYPRPADSALWFYGDTPDLMWIKNRTTTGLHTITDTVRGVGLNLVTSSAAAETSYPGVTEMNKFGMSIINDGTSILNGSTNGHVYWAWKAGGTTSTTSVTNTDGTITSQVSANRQAGFSIITYTGNGTAGATIAHGLGAVPGMIIVKRRDAAAAWDIYHSSIGATGRLYFTTDATNTSSAPWNNTAPTSSVFSVGTATDTNNSGSAIIAYCWAAIPGYSAFGSYTGNGSADGPFVYLGFRPRWIMWKRTDTTSAWFMYDAVRQTYNVMGQEMYADTSSAEGATTRMDFLSNGLKLRAANGGDNASGGTYIYMAMAEIPFKFARAR